MTFFLNLPNELIHEVLEAVLPEDLENFAGVCSRIHELSEPLLVKHRELIRKYCFTRGDNSEGDWNFIVDTLRKVQTDPRIGHYVKKLDICLMITGQVHD